VVILRFGLAALLFSSSLFVSIEHAFSHGFAGSRFFPGTLSTDDPFVADELSLPSVDIAKRITPNFGIEANETFLVLHPHGEHSVTGLGNLELGGKYEFLENDEHESIVSLGLGAEVGGTGSKRVGADTFSTWTPALFFGKGFGDLSQDVWLIRPLAITGVLT
jgi:hypothetical protein